jgi:hypothetical protein
VTVEVAQLDIADVEGAAAEGRSRTLRRRQLDSHVAPLPSNQAAARPEEWEGELDELGEGADGARRDARPAPAMAVIDGERLDPPGMDRDARREAGRLDGRRQERGLLADRLDEECPAGGQRDGQRETGISAPAAEVDELVDRALPEERDGREAVDDVADGDLGRIANRGQVDRGVPREEEAGMVLDRPADRGIEVETELGQAAIEGGIERRRQSRKALDARRERFTRTVQALLLSVVPPWPVRAPLPASSYVAPPIAASVFRDVSGSRPGLPVPLAGRVTRAISVRMPDVSGRRRTRQRGYPRIHVTRRNLWITDAVRGGPDGSSGASGVGSGGRRRVLFPVRLNGSQALRR